MRRYHNEIYEHNHNGETIDVNWRLTTDDEDKYQNTHSPIIRFSYKDIEVVESYEKDENDWWYITEFMCNMIDKLGKEKFQQFKKYYDEYTRLEDKYIIVNNNVYKPYINDSCRSGDFIRYIIFITMEDEERLDGETNINQQEVNPFSKVEYNKEQLINTLRYRVKQYFKDKNILPKEEFLEKKKTEKYKEIIKWFEENEILAYIIKK